MVNTNMNYDVSWYQEYVKWIYDHIKWALHLNNLALFLTCIFFLHNNRIQMKAIEGRDAQNVIDQLIFEGEKDPHFIYRVRLNEKGQLSALFWCDGMMREDYKIYVDVVIFDTT